VIRDARVVGPFLFATHVMNQRHSSVGAPSGFGAIGFCCWKGRLLLLLLLLLRTCHCFGGRRRIRIHGIRRIFGGALRGSHRFPCDVFVGCSSLFLSTHCGYLRSQYRLIYLYGSRSATNSEDGDDSHNILKPCCTFSICWAR